MLWGITMPIIAWDLAYSCQSFAVSFTFPEDLEGVPSDYVVFVSGFQNDTRTPSLTWNRRTGHAPDNGKGRCVVWPPFPK